MSFQTTVLKRLSEITGWISAVIEKTKSIDELPVQEALVETSKVHVSNNGKGESLEIKKIIESVPKADLTTTKNAITNSSIDTAKGNPFLTVSYKSVNVTGDANGALVTFDKDIITASFAESTTLSNVIFIKKSSVTEQLEQRALSMLNTSGREVYFTLRESKLSSVNSDFKTVQTDVRGYFKTDEVTVPNTGSDYTAYEISASNMSSGSSEAEDAIITLSLINTPSSSGGGASPTGLEKISIGNNQYGYGIIGRDTGKYGTIGWRAKDLSYSNSTGDYGATGRDSFAAGYNNKASGISSTTFGDHNIASAFASTAIGAFNVASSGYTFCSGFQNEASGESAQALGQGVSALSYGEVALGVYSTLYSPGGKGYNEPTDRVLNVGNGFDNDNRSDAFTIFKSGAAVFHPISKLDVQNPMPGMMIMDKDDGNKLKMHDGTNWNKVTTTVE